MGWQQEKDNMALGGGLYADPSTRPSPETRDRVRYVLVDIAESEEDLDMLISMLGLYIDDRDVRSGFGRNLPLEIDGEVRTKHKTYPPPVNPA